jgi:hypothetical protein
MTAIRRTLMRALFLAIGLLVLLGQVGQAADEQELGARYVKRLRKRVERLVLHPRSIGGRDGLLAYMETEHVPLEDICMLLQIFIEEAGEDLPPSDDEAEREELLDRRRWLATNAILRLPEMGCHGARPLLKEVALGEGKGELAEKLRDVAVGAVVELGGDDLVEFARAVYEDRQHFGGQDRFELYRDLALYVGVQAHVTVPYLLPKSERDRQAPRSDIFRFFRYALVHDEYISSGMLLDEVLHAASTLYAHSDERQEVLERQTSSRWSRTTRPRS